MNDTRFGDGNEGAQFGSIRAQNNTINFGIPARRDQAENISDDEQFLFSLAFEEMTLRERQIKDRLPDTCMWLLRNTEYQKWLLNKGLLWITGKPGSGKSTILKFSINEGNSISPSPVGNIITGSFFFDARGAPLQKTALGFYRSLLHQFYQQQREVLRHFVSNAIRSRGIKHLDQSLREDELRSQLKKLILDLLGTSSLDLYIDALDECADDSRSEVRQFILDICYESRTKPHPLGVCISCRPYPNEIQKSDYRVCVDEYNSGDIERCIRYHFDFTDMREVHKESLEETMIDQASGVFQWVDLVLPRVIRMNSEGAGIKKMLDEIATTPRELDTLYTQMLETITPRELPSSWSLLRWVCFAIRPLSLDELRFATVFRAQLPHKSIKDYINDEDICEDTDQMERRMRSLSRGLVSVKVVNEEEGDRVAQFIHQSVNEFMQRSGLDILYRKLADTNPEVANQVGYAHYDLARSCVQYLSMEEVLNIEEIGLYAQFKLPFLRYATLYWMEHARKSEDNGSSQEDLVQLFQWPSNHIVVGWIRLFYSMRSSEGNEINLGTNMTLFHVAAKYNLSTLVQRIITDSNGTNLGQDATPLYIAAAEGHVEVVRSLLAETSDIRTVVSEVWILLNAAISNGHAKVVELLLSKTPDIEAKDLRTSLNNAASYGHTEIVNLLLNQGAHIGGGGGVRATITPLMSAARNGHAGTVKLLLDYKADIEAKDVNNNTPLDTNIEGRNTESVELILKEQVNIEATDEHGYTALIFAIECGSTQVVKLLLDYKADIDATNKHGDTPLIVAADWEHMWVVKLLLDRQANVEAANKIGDTALIVAVRDRYRGKNVEVVKLLLDRMANVEATDKDGDTALIVAASSENIEAVEMLLDRQANVEATNKDGDTALIVAARRGSAVIVKLLLNKKVNIETTNNDGDTALIVAASWEKMEVVGLLLDEQANIELANKTGDTALVVAAANGSVAIIKQLLAVKGTISNSVPNTVACNEDKNLTRMVTKKTLQSRDDLINNEDGGPLHWAARFGHYKAFLLLLDHGVDPHTKDLRGYSVLHYAASGGSIDIVRLVLQIVDPRTIENPAWSPLHWACRVGSAKVVELLMKSGIDETAITTLEPRNTWNPYAIAFYHHNLKLRRTNDIVPCSQLTVTDCHCLEFDILTPLGAGGVDIGWGPCDGCFHDIYGPRFHCHTCQGIDYCFMCKFTAETTHPMHEWETFQPRNIEAAFNADNYQQRLTDLWKRVPALSSSAQSRRPGGVFHVGLGFRLPNDDEGEP